MPSDGRRPRRVAEQVRSFLSRTMTTELSDPRVSSVVITRVELTPDLGVANIRVRLLVGDDSESLRRATMKALGRAAPRLRRGLGAQLRVKRVPELRFFYDTDPDARARVEELLHEVHKEENEPGS